VRSRNDSIVDEVRGTIQPAHRISHISHARKKNNSSKSNSEKFEQHNQRYNRSDSTGIFVSNRADVPLILKGRPQSKCLRLLSSSEILSCEDIQGSDEKAIMRTKNPTHDHPIVSFSEYKPYSCRHAKFRPMKKASSSRNHQRQCAEWMWSKKAKRTHSHRNALLLFCLDMTLRLTFLHAVVVAISSPWNNLQRHVSCWLVKNAWTNTTHEMDSQTRF
jgi:hypothetical protein